MSVSFHCRCPFRDLLGLFSPQEPFAGTFDRIVFDRQGLNYFLVLLPDDVM